MRPKSLLFLTTFLLICFYSIAQGKAKNHFDKIRIEDFEQKIYSIDSNADAIIIADVGNTDFTGNNKGWFSLVFERHMRVKVLSGKALSISTIRIPLYVNGDEKEKLSDLEGVTYNLENGSVVESQLDKKDIFEDKIDKNHIEIKFSMPVVKDGSIFDIAYTITSDFDFNLQPWAFQHINYPCLWSEYTVTIPNLLNYVFLKQGIHKFFLEDSKKSSKVYKMTSASGSYYGQIGQDMTVSAFTLQYHWIMKDIPGFKTQDYITTPANYLDKIQFQLFQISNGETTRTVLNTWTTLAEQLRNRDDFGASLSAENYWLEKDLASIVNGAADDLAVAKKIFYYVKDNFTNTGNSIFLESGLESIYKNRKGSVGEINLLLIAMLRKIGLDADPVLLSTKDHGLVYKDYPLVSNFNYLIARLVINGKEYYLDASNRRLGFNRLERYCYNGNARVVDLKATSLDFNADSIVDRKVISVIGNNENPSILAGSVKITPGYYQSLDYRDSVAMYSNKEDFVKTLSNQQTEISKISNCEIDSLNNPEEPLSIKYDFTMNLAAPNLYINPMFGLGRNANPFKSEERVYPIDFPTAIDEIYTLNFDVPKGYEVVGLPKSMLLKLNENKDAIFEYQVFKENAQIFLRARLQVKRTHFHAEAYSGLRQFFDIVIRKYNEQIVCKKTQ
ncbi:MAG TPA: transglutaminase domain-containing protein [Chitinophagaceae bacterium]|nr:transglutaminase domain-containing protein [Chitinophagaceae bacterium]